MYLLGYIPKDNRLYLGDKDLNVVSYSLLLSVLEYQTAVMREDFETAKQVFQSCMHVVGSCIHLVPVPLILEENLSFLRFYRPFQKTNVTELRISWRSRDINNKH